MCCVRSLLENGIAFNQMLLLSSPLILIADSRNQLQVLCLNQASSGYCSCSADCFCVNSMLQLVEAKIPQLITAVSNKNQW